MKMKVARIYALLIFCVLGWARAEVKLNPLFADHAVLQCGVPVPIWGTANPGEELWVSFAGQTKTAKADSSGKWLVRLEPLAASAESRELTLTTSNASIRIGDVLVGEVWLAGGQSNMGSPLGSVPAADEVLAQAKDAQLRFFTVVKKTAAEPQRAVGGKWETATPQTAKGFSAVAYFFAREIRRTQKSPVAVLHGSWGGTPIETWISLDGLKREPALNNPLQKWEQAVAQHHKVQTDPKMETAYLADLERWQKEVEPQFNAAMKAYNAANAVSPLAREKPTLARPEPTNPDPMGMPSPSRRPQTPTVSFNAMIAPMIPYGIRGVIWYQGEQNGSAGLEYRELFPRLIQDWRHRWGAEFPFLFVQLPAHGNDTSPVAESGWPWLREAQFMALREPRTAMAITIDVGDPNNVHPADKLDVGARLALLARREVYGEPLVASGPLFRDYVVEDRSIRVRFRETGGGLTPRQAPWRAPGVEPLPTDRLIGFYIAGADRKWAAAEAEIDGESVLVSSPAVMQPVAVRYGWANSPRCNLYNRDGLPASPFRTDDWLK